MERNKNKSKIISRTIFSGIDTIHCPDLDYCSSNEHRFYFRSQMKKINLTKCYSLWIFGGKDIWVLTHAVSYLTWIPWRQRRHGARSLRAGLCSWSWGSWAWCPHAPTVAQSLWATTTQYSRHCIPTTSSTTYKLHNGTSTVCRMEVSTNTHRYTCHSFNAVVMLDLLMEYLHVPRGKELNEFVRLLVIFVGCIFKVLKVIRGHQR